MKPFVSISYVEQLSEKIAGILKRHSILTAYINTRDLSTVLKPVKDKLEKNEQCNVVYSIPYKGNNCQAAYIGQRKRPLKVRLGKHIKNIQQEPSKHNALTKHTIKDHFFDFERIRILDKETNNRKRLLFEMCHIAHCKNSVESKVDGVDLSWLPPRSAYVLSCMFTCPRSLVASTAVKNRFQKNRINGRKPLLAFDQLPSVSDDNKKKFVLI